jgi:hypothetical protein
VIQYFMLVENSFTETSDNDGNKRADAKNWKGNGEKEEKSQKDDEGQASTALDLTLGESERFSQAIGACDEHVRTRPGIARELQSPSPGVPRSARGRLWDVGSARYLQQLGFPALATTSAGFAFSQGLPDSEGALTCERNLG